MMVSKLIQGKS